MSAKFNRPPLRRTPVAADEDANGMQRGDPPDDEHGTEVLEARDGHLADEEVRVRRHRG